MADPSASPCFRAGCVASRSLSDLRTTITSLSTNRCRTVLVTGNLRTKSWADSVAALLANVPHVTAQAATNSPEQIAEILGLITDYRPKVVVALGGGGVMDAAKAAAALYEPDGRQRSWTARDVLTATSQRQEHGGVPVLAVPTTPGSGAEVTPNASIWTHDGKWTLRGEALRPRACVLDPSLIRGLGFSDVVSGMLDTFTHAVEAAWSIYSTETGDRYAAQAIQLVGEAVTLLEGQPEAPDKVLSLAQEAGHNAGHAITFTPTTSCHAVSYVLTRRRGLRHGHAQQTFRCGLLAPWASYATR